MATETETGNFIINAIKNFFVGGTETESSAIISNLKSLIDAHPVYNPNHVPDINNIVAPSRAQLLDTEIFNNFQKGGYNNDNQIKGIRSQNFFDDDDDDNLSDNMSEMYGGKRNKPSASDELHDEAVNYLKDDLKLSPLEARAYKSIAYRHIKETKPELTGLERAKEMLSLVKSDNFLDSYKDKLDETMKIIETRDEERSQRTQSSEEPKSEEEKPKKSSKKSRRSKNYQMGGNDFSETSVDQQFTESNANVPYYNEYRAMKAKYLQSKLQQNGGGFSETSIDQRHTESNANVPYYNEYRTMKAKYLESKLQQNGGDSNNNNLVFNSLNELQSYVNNNLNNTSAKYQLNII
jgi:hypothetical protein